jgi:hypothetical protein
VPLSRAFVAVHCVCVFEPGDSALRQFPILTAGASDIGGYFTLDASKRAEVDRYVAEANSSPTGFHDKADSGLEKPADNVHNGSYVLTPSSTAENPSKCEVDNGSSTAGAGITDPVSGVCGPAPIGLQVCDLVLELQRHLGSPSALKATCDSLKVAITDSRHIAEFHASNGMSALVAVLERYIDLPDVVEAVCKTIRIFKMDAVEDRLAAFREAGGIPLLVQAFQTHMDVASVMIAACNTLIGDNDDDLVFRGANGFPCLVEVLRRYSDSVEVVKAACRAIANVSQLDASQRVFIQAGIIPLLNETLRLHLNSPEYVEALGPPIAAIVRSYGAIKAFLDAGGVDALFDALQRHLDSAATIKEVCWALVYMVTDTSVASSFLAQGGVPNLIAILRFHVNVCDIVEHACALLINSTGAHAATIVAFRAAGAIPTLVAVLQAHTEQDQVVLNTCWALKNVTSSPESCIEFGEAGGMACLPPLIHSSRAAAVLKHACALLDNLTKEKALALIVLDTIGLDLLKEMAGLHPDAVPAQLLARLEALLEQRNFASSLSSVHGIDGLMELLQSYKDSTTIMAAACQAISATMHSDTESAALPQVDIVLTFAGHIERIVNVFDDSEINVTMSPEATDAIHTTLCDEHLVPLLVQVMELHAASEDVILQACIAARTLLGNPGDYVAFRGCRGVPLLLAVLEAHRCSSTIMPQACAAVATGVTLSVDGRSCFLDAGAIAALCAVLGTQIHQRNEDVMEPMCMALAVLTDDPDSQVAFREADGITSIIQRLKVFLIRSPVMTHAWELVNQTTIHAENASSFVSGGGYAILQKISAAHPDAVPLELLARLELVSAKQSVVNLLKNSVDSPTSAKAACDTVASAMVDPLQLNVFNQEDGMEAFVDVFRRYIDVPDVVGAACAALSAFGAKSAISSAVAFKEAGGIILLANVFSLHANSTSVVAAACGAVATMAKQHPVTRMACESAGIPALLAQVLLLHIDTLEVVKIACQAIETNATNAAADSASQYAGVMQSLVAVLQRQGDTSEALKFIGAAMLAVSRIPGSGADCYIAGGLPALVAMLTKHIEVAEIVEAGCGILRDVLRPDNEAAFRDAGGIPLVATVLAARSKLTVKPFQACAVVAMATASIGSRGAFRDAGTIQVLVKMHSRFRWHDQTAKSILTALANLTDTPESHVLFAAANGMSLLKAIVRPRAQQPILKQACALLYNVTSCNAENAAEFATARSVASLKKISASFPDLVSPILLAQLETLAENQEFGAKFLEGAAELAGQHVFANQAYLAFGSTASTLRTSRFVNIVAGYVDISTRVCALGMQQRTPSGSPVAQPVVTCISTKPTSLPGGESEKMHLVAIRNPLLNWHLHEMHVLESVRASMAPACDVVYVQPLCAVQSELGRSLQTTLREMGIGKALDGAHKMAVGLLVVLFDDSGCIQVVDSTTGEAVGQIGTPWGQPSTMRAEDGRGQQSFPWLVCRHHESRQICVSDNAWAMVYQLSIVPMPRPTELAASVLENPLLQQLKELAESSDKPIGYFAQFAYAHTEGDLPKGADDILRHLRGVDYIVATAAAALGLKLQAYAGIFHHPSTEPEDPIGKPENGEDIPRILSGQFFRPLDVASSLEEVVGATSRKTPNPSTLRWLNKPVHRERGSALNVEAEGYDEGGERSITVGSALVLVMSKQAVVLQSAAGDDSIKATSDLAGPEGTLQANLQQLCTASLWQCQGQLHISATQPIAVATTTPWVAELRFPIAHAAHSTAQLELFIRTCQPAGFGRGSEPVVDAAFRRALAVEAATLALNWHPAMTPIMGMIQSAIASSMPPLRAILSKVNVYEEGGFFKRHLDTPRNSKMIGSLVVCLPVPHSGGELSLRHEGKSVTIDWSQTEDSNDVVRWCAFYSDVEHEVLPVRSGHRVTLTYDLLADGLPATIFNGEEEVPLDFSPAGQLPVLPHPLSGVVASASRITQLIRQALYVMIGSTSYTWLGIFCSHAYPVTTRGPVDTKLLKGSDALVWAALSNEGWEMKVRPVYRYDKNVPWGAELDPNEPRSFEDHNYDARGYERYRVGESFSTFMQVENQDSSAPEWDSYVPGTSACERGIVWLNKPAHLVASGGWDHMIGNFPYTIDVFYGTVAIFVRLPRVASRAWERRIAAVRAFAAAQFK